MPEKTNDKTIFTLLEVMQSINRTLSNRYKSSFWVKAEMNKLNFYPQSGHCYPELVEKKDGKVIAQIKSVLWNDDYVRINHTFQQVLKEPLKNGIKILFCARITFDPAHGLSLRIMDIDPGYTLGDLEKEKQETIDKLKGEGLFHKNKSLNLPLLPQRIAIVSVETSKGYADFLKVIDDNPWRYKFFHLLFPALLQGERAVESIIQQLHRIRKVKNHFDVVAIIRGGGGDIGLSCYNHYQLSNVVASFPIPVITGIGHATNETVVEMIAFQNAITPTKLGEFLLQKFHNFSNPVRKAEEKLIDKSESILHGEKTKLYHTVKFFRSITENTIIKNQTIIQKQVGTLVHQSRFLVKHAANEVNQKLVGMIKSSGILSASQRYAMIQLQQKLSGESLLFLKKAKTEVSNLEKNVNNMNPKNVLRRGYSISLLNGKAVKSFDEVKEGEILHTLVFNGNIISRVVSTNSKNET